MYLNVALNIIQLLKAQKNVSQHSQCCILWKTPVYGGWMKNADVEGE